MAYDSSDSARTRSRSCGSRNEYLSPRNSSSGEYSTRVESFYPPPPQSHRRSRSTSSLRRSRATGGPSRRATTTDTRKHHIPQSCCLKNWDPAEKPFILLGSVFDARSLGKWIFDWVIYRHGPFSHITDMAGELWLLLIQLVGNPRIAKDCISRIRKDSSKALIKNFINSTKLLEDEMKRILNSCETPMLRAGKEHGQERAPLGKDSGIEFVETIFGRQLQNTKNFMNKIRSWNFWFNTKVKNILHDPHA